MVSFLNSIGEKILKNLHLVISVLVCGVIALLLLTFGNGNLFVVEQHGYYFDELSKSLLKGKLDIPGYAIGGEAFVHNDKVYGYFGFIPALLRIPVHLITNYALMGNISRIFMVISYILTIVASIIFLKVVTKEAKYKKNKTYFFDIVYVLLFGLTTTTFFLMSNGFVYHESIIVGSVFISFFCVTIYKYLTSLKTSYLIFSHILVFAALHSRIIGGFGSIAVLSLITFIIIATKVLKNKMPILMKFSSYVINSEALEKLVQTRYRTLAIQVVSICLIFASALFINWIKFGDPKDFIPLEKNLIIQSDKVRLERYQTYYTGFINKHYIVHNIPYYFMPGGIYRREEFPWYIIYVERPELERYKGMDHMEETPGLLEINPLLAVLILVGLIAIFSSSKFTSLRIIVLGLSSCVLAIISSPSISYRYMHDMYPFFMVTGTVGFLVMAMWLNNTNTLLKIFVKTVLIWLIFSSFMLNLSWSIIYRFEVGSFHKEKRLEFLEIQNQIKKYIQVKRKA